MTVSLAFGLFACGTVAPTGDTVPESTASITESTPATAEPTPATQPTFTETEPVPTETEPPVPTEPEHSALYLPEVSQEDMIAYFNETVLSAEYSTGDGDPSLVQKWDTPIRYRIYGEPAEEDLVVLEQLFAQLNEIEGFPGITPDAPDGPEENLSIHFLPEDAFYLAFSDMLGGDTANGAVQFWYHSDINVMYSGRIGYRTDIPRDQQNSILLEEVINLLGFNDTVLREDSIIYQYSDETTALSDVDWVLVKLLYHPDMQCGMNADQCREILEKLYY